MINSQRHIDTFEYEADKAAELTMDEPDEAPLKLDEVMSELQHYLHNEIEHDSAYNYQQNSEVKNLPNDWQDFEPADWDDTDLFS